jgi:hypothetical protein
MSQRTRRTAASTAQAAIKRSTSTTTDIAFSSTARRRALTKNVSYAEVPAGVDDPEASDRSSDVEQEQTVPLETPLDDEGDAEDDEDVVMEDVNGELHRFEVEC